MTFPLAILIIVVVGAIIFALNKRSNASVPVPTNIMDPNGWEIGPIDSNGENYSVNMPPHPQLHPEGWSIDIPYPNADAGHVHYVTIPTDSLVGKDKVTLRCRLEMAPGVKLVPVHFPDAPSLLTLYFQRKHDDWTAQGAYETYRWYASFGTQTDLHAGEYVLEARFDQNWTAVLASSRTDKLDAFNVALLDAGRIGFVLGGGDGLGHGVYATGPVKLVVTEFTVQ